MAQNERVALKTRQSAGRLAYRKGKGAGWEFKWRPVWWLLRRRGGREGNRIKIEQSWWENVKIPFERKECDRTRVRDKEASNWVGILQWRVKSAVVARGGGEHKERGSCYRKTRGGDGDEVVIKKCEISTSELSVVSWGIYLWRAGRSGKNEEDLHSQLDQ